MKNLILFFQKIRFILFFFILQIMAFAMIRNGKGYQKTALVSSANNISGWFYEKDRAIKDYFALEQINQALIRENIRLRHQTLKNFQRVNAHAVWVNDTLYKLQYQYIPGTVIKNMTSSRFNILTLNVGAEDGIKREMGVISTNGIIGFVKDVSRNFCTVIPVMNEQFRITAKSKKEDLFGTVVWRGEDSFNKATIEKVPNYIDLKKGDTMVTTTYEGIFPKGLPIGIVKSITEEPGSNYKTVKLDMTTDFHNLNKVYIIKNTLREEFLQLQENQE